MPKYVLLSSVVVWVAGCTATQETPGPERGPDAAASADTPLGLSPSALAVVRDGEAFLAGSIDPTRLSNSLKALTARPHVAGSPANRQTAELVRRELMAAGFETRIDQYEVLLPYPLEVSVELLRPTAYRANLDEAPLDKDFDTHTGQAIPPYLAYSPDGDVTGPLVYLNYGRREDFESLKERGIELKGALGIARYGKIFRGSKVKNAAHAGMVGILIYSDPADDGFVRGDVYPDGPWRPESAVQRGSILDIGQRPGDPLTPDGPADAKAPRIHWSEAKSIPTIPAAPMSYREIRPFLHALDGPQVPAGWQGGLPFTYHLGGTAAVVAHLRVRSDWEIRRIVNVVGTLRGTVDPDQWILMGNHRDAWVHGAVDPGSGTAVLIETARVLGALARAGTRPARSIVLCSFDGEEFGLLGSTEFVEQYQDELDRHAVLYLNCDAAVSGEAFHVAASPELATLIDEALAAIPDDRAPGRSLTDAVRTTRGEGDPPNPPGGGSDHVPFLHRLAVPVVDISSSGPFGVYHSLYDTYGWMKRFGDPGFKHHARVARATTHLVWRAANATVLPFDFEAGAAWLHRSLSALKTKHPECNTQEFDKTIEELLEVGAELKKSMARALARDPDPTRLLSVNRQLVSQFRKRLKNNLLPARPFYRNLHWATDPETVYDGVALPALVSALEARQAPAIAAALADLKRCADTSLAELKALVHGFGVLAESLPAPVAKPEQNPAPLAPQTPESTLPEKRQ